MRGTFNHTQSQQYEAGTTNVGGSDEQAQGGRKTRMRSISRVSRVSRVSNVEEEAEEEEEVNEVVEGQVADAIGSYFTWAVCHVSGCDLTDSTTPIYIAFFPALLFTRLVCVKDQRPGTRSDPH
jgi:hypothetical protein